jgi:rubrerythrin
VLLIIVSVWFEGGIAEEAKWQARVNELQAKVAKAETESANANTRLVTEIAKNREKIASNQAVVKQAIQQNIQAINRQCKLTDVSVQMYNQAVKGGAQ